MAFSRISSALFVVASASEVHEEDASALLQGRVLNSRATVTSMDAQRRQSLERALEAKGINADDLPKYIEHNGRLSSCTGACKVLETKSADNELVCGERCETRDDCHAFQYYMDGFKAMCRLQTEVGSLSADEEYILYEKAPCYTAVLTDCTFDTMPKLDDKLTCIDGSSCSISSGDGWNCCSEKGGRAQCPEGFVMCVESSCGRDESEPCCSSPDHSNCGDKGGYRQCEKLTNIQTSKGAAQLCKEGTKILSGDTCTVQCASGFTPSVASMTCNHGDFSDEVECKSD